MVYERWFCLQANPQARPMGPPPIIITSKTEFPSFITLQLSANLIFLKLILLAVLESFY
jgi:hypothetical protein